MVNRRAVLGLMLATTIVGSVTTASAAREATGRPTANRTVVATHITQSDVPFTTLIRVGDRLVLVLQTPRGVLIVKLPNFGGENHVDIFDAPDGGDPLGVKEQVIRSAP